MKIAVIKERALGETRVAVTPDIVKKLIAQNFQVYVEKHAGEGAGFSDNDYREAGATISAVPLEILADADVVLGVQPVFTGEFDLLSFLCTGALVIGILSPYEQQSLIKKYAHKKITCFALDLLPRITRAQSMDVLSSQNNLAGYRAVIDGAYHYTKAFPMMMTAAGTIAPARVLILGAGVAGLQAIATAKRMGAIVTAFDVRSATKEQVESLGAKFIAVEDTENTLGQNAVYAKEMSEQYKQKQQQLIADTIKSQDIVISTALIPGRKAPQLISASMVESMKPGSVIVDLATASGGNCEVSKKDEVIIHNLVKIIGYSNFPARVAVDASRLYAKNLYNFLELLIDKTTSALVVKLEDALVSGSLITYSGEVVHQSLKEAYKL
jgi:NAD(P) transhydrogenase subunit alpha